jgi:hypothetical protein
MRGTVKCLSATGAHWLRRRARPLVVKEKFALHGMPSFRSDGISNTTLTSLIGNSFNLHCVIPLVLSILVHMMPFLVQPGVASRAF